jgi:ligand-binding sensor domain-containing protein
MALTGMMVKHLKFSGMIRQTPTLFPETSSPYCEDKKGLLWITTQDGGLSCFNRNEVSSKQFEQYKYDSKNKGSVPANNLNALTIDKDDNIWAASESNGVFKIDHKTKEIMGIPGREGDTTTSNFTYGCDVLKTDYRNKIWCGSYGNALVQLDPARHTIKNYDYFESSTGIKLPKEFSVHCLFPDKALYGLPSFWSTQCI